MRIQTFGEDMRICGTSCLHVESWIPRSAATSTGKIFLEIYLEPGMTMQRINNVASGMPESAVENFIFKMLKQGLVRYSFDRSTSNPDCFNRFWPTWRLGDILRNVMREIPSIDVERLVGDDGYVTEECEDIF